MSEAGIVEGDGRVSCLRLAGRLDSAAAASVREQVARAAAGGAQLRLLVDFRQVDFIDSMALGTLAVAAAAVRDRGGEIVLCAMAPAVRRAFEVTQLHKLLDIVEDEATALRWLA